MAGNSVVVRLVDRRDVAAAKVAAFARVARLFTVIKFASQPFIRMEAPLPRPRPG